MTLKENLVYEVLLVTRLNVTPVGVVRRGRKLRFKLFPGKSFRELSASKVAVIQLTNDPELLVKTALNLPVEFEFEEVGAYRWVKGLPGWLGKAECRLSNWEDELGRTEVLECEFSPEKELEGNLPPRPFSRTDCILVEMGILFTRYLVRKSEKTRAEIERLYGLYTHLGGSSEVADYIISNL